MRLAAVLSCALLVACAGEASPRAAAGSNAPRPTRIRFAEPEEPRADDEDDVVAEHREAAARVRRAVVADLERAGYEIVPRGPHDLDMELSVVVRTRPHERTEVREVWIVLFDAQGRIVDRIRYEAAEGAPGRPERVSRSLVDAVVASKDVDRARAKTAPPK